MTSPANNATVPSRTVTFTGTGAPGSTVSILDAAGAALSGTSPSTVGTGGTWSLTATFAPTVPVTVPLVASQKTGGAASGTVSLTIHLPAAPAIALSTSAAPTSFTAPGQAITFRYLVTNTGDVALTSIGVTDNAIGPGGVQCPASTLAPGAGETCTRSYTTTQANVDAGSITSSATATGAPPTGAAVSSPPSSLNVPGPKSTPAIAVATSASRPNFTAPGQLITYRYVVANTGNVTLSTIAVSDNRVSASNLRCPVAVLAPGARESCSGAYTTTPSDVHTRSVTSSAVAQGTPPHSATPVRSTPSTNVVPLAVSPVRHLSAVAHRATISPARPRVTG